nr:putative ribonuclease H-like domain-containing protein [Tanacetum cinerariifolium]
GQPKLGLWYPKDSPFDLEAYTDSDYAGASLDRKSTTGCFQFQGCRLISWQCKKKNIVANSAIEAEYIAASNCCGQVLWIQNQLLDYGYNFMNTKIFIDSESTICIVKNLVFHSKTKHIEIRHHFIRDSYEKRLIQVIKIHTDYNVTDLLTKAFDIWFTAKTKTFNNETQICVKVDGKSIVITESSVRRDLQFNDEDDEIVHEERGDRVERAATTASSLEAEQDSDNIHRTQSMVTLNKPIPQRTGLGSGLRRQDTISGDKPAQTRFERLSKQSHELPLSRVNTLGSREDSMQLMELMELCKLSERVLALENITTAKDLKITNLKKRVKRLKKRKKSRTPQLKRRLFRVRIESSAKKSLGDQEDVSNQGRNIADFDQNERILFVQEDAETQERKIKRKRIKRKTSKIATRPTRGVIIKEASETTTRLTIPPQQLVPKGKEVVEGSGKKAKSSIKESVSKKRTRKGLDKESVKRQKLEDDAKKEKLKACLEIVPNDDKAINIEPLATKSLTVDWETQILGDELFYYQIKRADGSYKVYKVF